MSAEQLKQRDAMQRLTDFLNEVGMLRHTPRSGYKFLGSGQETVAEHSHRTAVIGYVLAKKTGADAARTVMLCLFHDLPEARTGDFNYVNRLYDTSRERDALEDAVEGTGLEEDIMSIWDEHACRTTPESLLAHDADQLDLILNLKRESDLGNRYADKWLESAVERLRTDIAKGLAQTILKTDHTDWWYLGPDRNWWESFAYADRILENWKKAGVSAVADVQAQDAAFAAKKAQNTSTAQTAEKPQRAQKQNRFINYTQSEWDFAELERLEREQREKW